uniref:Integrase catalytic region n=1 Tax=Caulobacter sp. (strain K31) TaxID=366602 RepID=B0T9X9_CAUSK
MPTERLSMRRIRDLLRLKFENGLSSRLIATSLGISKGSVGDYLQRAQVAGLSWPLPDDMTDTALERRLFPGPPAPSVVPRCEPNWAQVDQELRRPGVTRSLLWQEYRADHPDGYGYAWFCQHYDAWKRRVSPTMRQNHAAGEKVFVDFAGDTIDVIDPLTGVAQAMKLFVAALGASSYVYCEARPSEGLADWIGCHVGMFAFFGGVTAIIVCDNLKSGVTKPDRYEPGINRTYQDMARHYGTTVMPARPYKPRDKAKVEQSVLLVERWVLARLRNRRHAAWTPARILAAAEKIGPATAALSQAIMTDRPHPEQGFRTCLGILALEKTYGPARLEAACQRGDQIKARSVSSIRSILKTGLDRAFLEPEPDPQPLSHGNIRGRAYFH